MSFEQLVRPFAARSVLKTSRTVPTSVAAVPETAVLSWGAVGQLPFGVKQEPGVDLEVVGFTVENCNQDWKQRGEPETEEVDVPVRTSPNGPQIGTTTVERIKKISFSAKQQVQPFSYVAAGVAESVSGLSASIPGFNKCDHSYSFNWNS